MLDEALRPLGEPVEVPRPPDVADASNIMFAGLGCEQEYEHAGPVCNAGDEWGSP